MFTCSTISLNIIVHDKESTGFHPWQGFEEISHRDKYLNIPRMVVYAPKPLGGIGMQRLHITQGVRNVTQMLKHVRAKSTVGKLLLIDIVGRYCGVCDAQARH